MTRGVISARFSARDLFIVAILSAVPRTIFSCNSNGERPRYGGASSLMIEVKINRRLARRGMMIVREHGPFIDNGWSNYSAMEMARRRDKPLAWRFSALISSAAAYSRIKPPAAAAVAGRAERRADLHRASK